MSAINIRQGAVLPLRIEADETAVSITVILKHQTEDVYIEETENIVDGVADFQIEDTDVVGVYDLQINENFETGLPNKYPIADCDGDCDFIEVNICEALDEETS